MNIKNMRVVLLSLFFFTSVATISSCKSKPKDADIQSAVSTKLSANQQLSAVHANVSEGVVTLTGECRDETAKMDAENTAKGTEGVVSVVNNVSVAPPPAPPVTVSADDQLTKGVADATKDFPKVQAKVQDGVVTLTGEIKKTDLRKLMQSLHSLNPKKIDNQLKVK